MNWGKGILITILLFISAMVGIVTLSFKQSIELLDEKYYEKEVVFQERIDAEKNLLRLGTSIQWKDSAQYLWFHFPPGANQDISSGQIELLRLSDKNHDRIIPLTAATTFPIKIDKSDLIVGNYTARIKWNANGTDYFQNLGIFIQ